MTSKEMAVEERTIRTCLDSGKHAILGITVLPDGGLVIADCDGR